MLHPHIQAQIDAAIASLEEELPGRAFQKEAPAPAPRDEGFKRTDLIEVEIVKGSA